MNSMYFYVKAKKAKMTDGRTNIHFKDNHLEN